MKKILLSVLTCISIAGTASAQLAEGSVFPDFTFTDIHGHVQHLYAYLDAGKTVFIDISATWCPPCWNYHIGHHLDSLYAQHGPAGDSGVNATTTNDVQVLFVQGEPTSGMAELTYNHIGTGAILFTTTESPQSQITQGDWTAGTYYPIIDDSTGMGGSTGYDALWNITYFPTIYMICRDHLVHVMSQPNAWAAYQASLSTCPTYAPASGTSIDAKAVPYNNSNYFICNANPSVSFQNYSTTTNITSATINVKDASGTTVGTGTYSGTLAPMAVANVTIPSFAGTSFGGYKYSVTVTGDVNTTNNSSLDSIFVVYDAANAASIPDSENFNEATIPYKEYSSTDGYNFPLSNAQLILDGYSGYTDARGGTSTSLVFELGATGYYLGAGATTYYILGNYNTTSATGLSIAFDYSCAQSTAGSTSDALSVEVSTDCGSTWNTVWTENGSTLATAPANSTSFYVPTSASLWAHKYITIGTYNNANTMIKFVGTGNSAGNSAWVDNIVLKNTPSGVTNVNNIEENIIISPNPAKESTNLSFNLNADEKVQIVVTNAIGQVVANINKSLNAGLSNIELSTTDFLTGIYNVQVIAGNTAISKKLTIVK